MFENRVKQLLQDGQATIGLWLTLPSPAVAEMISSYELDWLLIDTEHGAADYETVEEMIRAMKGTPVVPLIRVAGNDPVLIKKGLDRGAYGVVVPLVSTAEQAIAAVRATRFPPEGIRGVAGTRLTRYGADLPQYVREWNRQVLMICQLETADAVQNAGAIAGVDGVDVLFVGPNDLSANLGAFREFERAEFTRAVDRILQAARRSGKAAGIMAGGPEDALTRLDQGFTFVSVTSDARLLSAAVDAAFRKVREGLVERSGHSRPTT